MILSPIHFVIARRETSVAKAINEAIQQFQSVNWIASLGVARLAMTKDGVGAKAMRGEGR